jgi:hypothetical protein
VTGSLRIGDAERERAAAELGEHFAEGRLANDEYDERLDAIWTARTGADLAPVFEDLPQRRTEPVPAPTTRRGGRSRRLPVLPVVAVLVALSILTDALFWLLIFVLMAFGALGQGHRSRRCG